MPRTKVKLNLSPEMNQTDIAWLAGLVDGEGCITMHFSCNYSATQRKFVGRRIYCSPEASIQITEGGVWQAKVEEILNSYGVHYTLYYTGPMPRGKGRIAHYHIRQWGHVIRFIELVSSFLRIKQNQARIVLELGNNPLPLTSRKREGDHWIRTVNWENVKIMLDAIDGIRTFNGNQKRGTLIWTREKIESTLRLMEKDVFPCNFATNHPRKRKTGAN